MESIRFNGVPYRRYPDSPRRSDRLYFTASYNASGEQRLHRAVWAAAHGPIPDGHHVHHIDGDPLNNDVSNLRCVTPKEHIAEHMSPERSQWQREHAERIRPLAAAWHSSPDGRAWHSATAKAAWEGREPQPGVCEQCGAGYESLKPGRFCSNKCKSAWRRDSGLDDEQRACVVCGDGFTINRYAKQRTCGGPCVGRLQSLTKRGLQPDGVRQG